MKKTQEEKIIELLLNGFSPREIKKKLKVSLREIRKIETQEINKHKKSKLKNDK